MPTVTKRPDLTPKGERTMNAILDAAREIITAEGMGAASQDSIARRAGISQSTLRHYFPTKEQLVSEIYRTGFQRTLESVEADLPDAATEPEARLLRMARNHLHFIMARDGAYAFESFAHLARNAGDRRYRDEWYEALAARYADLIGRIRPGLAETECRRRAFQIMTLCLGGWLTMTESRPRLHDASSDELVESALAGIRAIMHAD